MTIKKVPAENKIFFIRWFLKNHSLKEKEFSHYLIYLINNPNLLEKVHFVYETKKYKQSLILNTVDSWGKGVIYKYKHTVHFDSNTIFSYIHHNLNDNDLFIKLEYPEYLFCDLYGSVLSDDLSECNLSHSEQLEVDSFLEYNYLLLKKEFLLSELDKSLDNNDKECFENSSSELKKVEQEIKKLCSNLKSYLQN